MQPGGKSSCSNSSRPTLQARGGCEARARGRQLRQLWGTTRRSLVQAGGHLLLCEAQPHQGLIDLPLQCIKVQALLPAAAAVAAAIAAAVAATSSWGSLQRDDGGGTATRLCCLPLGLGAFLRIAAPLGLGEAGGQLDGAALPAARLGHKRWLERALLQSGMAGSVEGNT